MNVQIIEESRTDLDTYGRVSDAFQVRARYRVVPKGRRPSDLTLVEEAVPPYVKDYDSLEGGPATWSDRWDLSTWGVLAA